MTVFAVYRNLATPAIVIGGYQFIDSWLTFEDTQTLQLADFQAALAASDSTVRANTRLVSSQIYRDDLDSLPEGSTLMLIPGPPGPPGEDGEDGADSTVPGPRGDPGAASTVPGPPGVGINVATTSGGSPDAYSYTYSYVSGGLALGNGSIGSLYELNSNGQDALTPGLIQIVNKLDVNNEPSSTLEVVQFGDNGKPVVWNVTKSRGNGIIGDTNCHKLGLQGDRLFTFAINSGGYKTSYIDAGLPRGGSLGGHAGYLTWTQEFDTNTADPNNAVHAMFHLVGSNPSASYVGQGGIQGNCFAQVYFSGPNQGQHNARDFYKGLVEIGAATGAAEKMQALVFNSAALVDPVVNPTHIWDGGLEYYAGDFWCTHASNQAGVIDRRKILTIRPFVPGAVPTNGSWTASVRWSAGGDCAELTVVVGGADVTAFAGRVNFTALAGGAIPMVVGSHISSNLADGTQFRFAAGNARITVNIIDGATHPMKANETYIFTMILRQV